MSLQREEVLPWTPFCSGFPGHCLHTGQHCWRIDGAGDEMRSSGREMATVKAERGLCGGNTVSFLSVAWLCWCVTTQQNIHARVKKSVDLQRGSGMCKWGFYGVRSQTMAHYVCQPSSAGSVCVLSLFPPVLAILSSTTFSLDWERPPTLKGFPNRHWLRNNSSIGIDV